MSKFFRIAAVVLVTALSIAVLVGWYLDSQVTNPLHEPPGTPVAAAVQSAPNPLRTAYFGELHLHTAISLDAQVFGTSAGPRTAYRFARGEPVELPAIGSVRQLAQPLDFAAVTDHAEGMGLQHLCYTRDSSRYWNPQCIAVRHRVVLMFPRMFRSLQQDGNRKASYDASMCGAGGALCITAAMKVWQNNQDAAEEFYEPGRFTTLHAFEYTPTLREGGMLHRNVIFRTATVPENVFAAQDGFAEDMLRWLERDCTGDCRGLSIPHNSNFSWGLAFGSNSDGSALTRENAELRARMESSIEIFQAKGSSECAIGVATNDEQCGFEQLWPTCSAEQLQVNPDNGQHAARCASEADMVRNALRRGLLDEQRWGVNPFKYGIVAATDNHNAMPGDTEERGFEGHGGVNDARAERRLGIEKNALQKQRRRDPSSVNPGGLAGVWAEQNTREAIWDALKRKESFGTSGTRITVRLFGGYGFPEDWHLQHDAIAAGYARGVPMGGDLPASDGVAPAFAVWALRDPRSAPLQRIQVVKGWVDGERSSERVYDVACSDGLQPDPQTWRCPDNGATVNVADCAIPEDKGAAELATTWTDPDFRADQSAFYYVRVLENPVCRYSQHDALALGVAHPDKLPPTIQERAWTSPIWYTPR